MKVTRIFRNPILPGFYPDPSICRVGEDYYLVTSTFEYFPGLPIFHSRDLINWRQIGHALDRPSQLNLDGVMASRGLYAPTIRHHAPSGEGDGRFYITNTLVSSAYDTLLNDGVHERNFIVTAEDPAGPWSEPYWLEGAPGIDPSLFFDTDGAPSGEGVAWYTGNRVPPGGPAYPHHKEIWLQELDLKTMQLTGPRVSLWDGAVKGNLEVEAPHIYKKDGYYYLLVAEGGTEHHHAVTIARSRSISGPYAGNPRNPLLTHRNLGLDHPIACTGHAELVETQNGEWWMALLATRPYGGYFYNLGRETFLVPVIWEYGWPIVSPGIGRVEFEHHAPDLPAHPWPPAPARDDFDDPELAYQWNFLRTPREEFYNLSERPGFLRLKLRPEKLSELANPSFVGRRQQHINFCAQAALEFRPANVSECAGLVLLQNNDFHFRFVITRGADGGQVVRLIKREAGADTILAERPVADSEQFFKVQAQGQAYSFYIAEQAGKWQPVAEDVDGRILSTNIAGGFVGAYIGMYASSNGQVSANSADFDWFEYSSSD
jgi:alpha-N-arabinofuranosidase